MHAGWGLVALALARVAAADGPTWERVGERDGIVIERHAADGASLEELRLTTRSPLRPAAILATLWRQQEFPQFVPYLKRLDVLRDDGDAKLIYEQIHVPLLKDRDVTLRTRRTVAPDSGVCEVTSVAAPDDGPPENGDHVRVRTSESRWHLAPAPDGGTDVTYTIRTDGGGAMPAWVLHAAQKDAAAKLVHAMLVRAAARAAP
jgi:ribosome-associated toxin RatA of RatAB toxin-antitoxin module